MDNNVNRRQFLKNSAFGIGGLLLLGPGSKDVDTQLLDFQDVYRLDLTPNTWSKIVQDPYGARRFSSFRYVPEIDRFLLWGYHGFDTDDYGNPEQPWTGNKEYDMVAFHPEEGRWENHFPIDKAAEWSKALPPMHEMHSYQGITPGYYYTGFKEREGVLRPDLNIVGDQVAYDSKRRRMIYFSGGRTFAYHVEKREWSDIGGDTAPPPVSFGSLCYDPAGDRIILFGGGHVAEQGADGRLAGYTGTWIFDCTSSQWSRLNSPDNPPPRLSSRLVCDTRNQKMVVFGGDGQTQWLADTWILDLKKNTWRKSKSYRNPEARADHFAVYDPGTGLVIIGGGHHLNDLTDMWGYDAAKDSWSKLQGQTPVGWHITADIIQDKGLIVLTTSAKTEGDKSRCNEIYPVRTTWAYQIRKQGLTDRTSAQARIENAMPKRSIASITAGVAPDPARKAEQLNRIKNMQDNQWVHFKDPGRAAPVRAWGSCAFDTDKGRIIYWGGGHCGYGGNDYDYYDVEQHTWLPGAQPAEHPGRSWDKGVAPGGVTFSGGPWTTHGRKIYAYDPVSKKVINTKTISLTAGYLPQGLKDLEPLKPNFGEKGNYTRPSHSKYITWACDEEGNRPWEIVCSALPGLELLVQTPRGVMAVDANWGAVDNKNRADMSSYKGQPMVDNSVYALSVADRKWTKLTSDGPWPQNLYEFTALVYDSRRNQLILHGAGKERDELWRFPLDKGLWEKLEPGYADGAGSRAPECNREAVYCPDEDVFFTAARVPGEGNKPAFWAYHVGENKWYTPDIQPPAGKTMRDMVSRSCAWSYDPIHGMVLMLLGSGDESNAEVYGMKYRFKK